MKNENLILKLYATTATLFLLFMVLTSQKSKSTDIKFDEITVQRINVIEPDGKLKMVISNRELQHPGMRNGVERPARKRDPGILFFNEEQDEVGGLMYNGSKDAGGNNIYLSFDQYKQDQIMQLRHYSSRKEDYTYGLTLFDIDKNFSQERYLELIDSLDRRGYNYPRKLEFMREENGGNPVQAYRMLVGKDYNTNTGVFIRDKFGKERLKVFVDANNEPRIEVLDEKGNVIKDLLQ